MIFKLLTLFPFPWNFLYATNSFFDISLITWLLYQFPQKHTNNVKKFCKFILKSFRIINWFAYCIKCTRFPVICFAKFCNLALIDISFYNNRETFQSSVDWYKKQKKLRNKSIPAKTFFCLFFHPLMTRMLIAYKSWNSVLVKIHVMKTV